MSIAAYQGICPTCRHDHSAPIPALASGSGDHAELADQAKRDIEWSCLTTVRPSVLLEILAENAALRASIGRHDRQVSGMLRARLAAETRATEAERKLAEADKALELAAIRFDEIYEAAEVDDVAYRNEATIHGINGLADVAQAEIRTFLSKEAERG